MLSNRNKPMDEIGKESHVSRATLFRWIKQYGAQTSGLKKRSGKPQDWSMGAKLRAILETQALNEQEIGEYLRKNGLYYFMHSFLLPFQ